MAWYDSLLRDPTYDTTDVGQQLATPGFSADQALYGGYSQNDTQGRVAIDSALKAVSDAAGLPNYDWRPALEAFSGQHYQQFGSTYQGSTPFQNIIAGVVANDPNPQIQSAWQQVGPQITQDASQGYQSFIANNEARDKRHKLGMLAAVAAPLAAWGGAALLGGGSAGAAGGTGLSAGATGAGGLSLAAPEVAGAAGLGSGLGTGVGTAGTAGTALGSGFFGAEALAPLTGAAGGAAAAGGSSALGRLLGLGQTGEDVLKVGGAVVPSLLGMYASDKQTDAYKDLANQYMAMGAPYRQGLADITNDPNKFFQGQQAQLATDAVLRRLSAGGNPAANPYMQAQGINALWNEYGKERDRLAGYGGLTAYNAAAPGAANQAIGSQANIYNALGYGIDKLTAPKAPTLQDLLRGANI
jgi:hypothetical protein